MIYLVDTCKELKLIGNCLKGSRPLLSFDKAFEEEPYLRMLQQLFVHAFNTPNHHPKSKPFIDHVFCFYFYHNRIWFRNYQVIKNMLSNFIDNKCFCRT